MPSRQTESETQRATARHLAEQLRTDYSDSSYAHFAALYQAKFAAEAQDWAAAEQVLQSVVDGADDPLLVVQAKIRLARVAQAQAKHDAALALLQIDEPGAYGAMIAELRGDILLARGERDAARTAYLEAQSLLQAMEQPLPNPLLTMKIQDLAVVESEAVREDETAQ